MLRPLPNRSCPLDERRVGTLGNPFPGEGTLGPRRCREGAFDEDNGRLFGIQEARRERACFLDQGPRRLLQGAAADRCAPACEGADGHASTASAIWLCFAHIGKFDDPPQDRPQYAVALLFQERDSSKLDITSKNIRSGSPLNVPRAAWLTGPRHGGCSLGRAARHMAQRKFSRCSPPDRPRGPE